MSQSEPGAADPPYDFALGRRRLIAAGLAVVGIAAHRARAQPAQSAGPSSLSEAVRFLAHQKSAAEQYAIILATAGKDDPARYVRGIQLYADAKADFDALIAEFRFPLHGGGDPAASSRFRQALQDAA